jgi:hypothetical protein
VKRKLKPTLIKLQNRMHVDSCPCIKISNKPYIIRKGINHKYSLTMDFLLTNKLLFHQNNQPINNKGIDSTRKKTEKIDLARLLFYTEIEFN